MNLLLLILDNYEQHYFIYHCVDFLQFDPMFTYSCNPGQILKNVFKRWPSKLFYWEESREKGVHL